MMSGAAEEARREQLLRAVLSQPDVFVLIDGALADIDNGVIPDGGIPADEAMRRARAAAEGRGAE